MRSDVLSFTLTGKGFLHHVQKLTWIFVLFGFIQFGYSQCPTSCNLNVQVSMDGNCEAVISPDVVLEGDPTGGETYITCQYSVTILDENDAPIGTTNLIANPPIYPKIDVSHIGKTLKVSVGYTDSNGDTYSCWGYLNVEDKLAPVVDCLEDVSVACTKPYDEDLMTTTTATYLADTSNTSGSPGVFRMDLEIDNQANPWERIDYARASIIIPSGQGVVLSDLNIELNRPASSGLTAVPVSTYDPATGRFTFDLLNEVQIRNEDFNGTWEVDITGHGGSLVKVNSFRLEIKSTSIFLNPPDTNENCTPEVDFIFLNDNLISLECDDQFILPKSSYKRVITYAATDDYGNQSDPCELTIYYTKPSIFGTGIEYPNDTTLKCEVNINSFPIQFSSDWDDNANGYPDPSDAAVGIPTIDGTPISLIEENNLCKISLAYTDNLFSICGSSSFKLQRIWTILDWCESESRQHLQNIKVLDEQPPYLVCPPDTLTFVADPGLCSKDVLFEPWDENAYTGIDFLYDCSTVTIGVEYLVADDRDVDIVTDNFIPAIDNGDGTFTAPDVPADTFWVKYIVTDGCGNFTECRFESIVTDQTAPYAICDQYTAVALSEDGWARTNAIAFDDGSYDECGDDVSFKVRRVNSLCQNVTGYDRNDEIFGDYVQFCCSDASEDYVQVELMVTDISGNSSTCVVNVQVQDKFGPYINTCPQSTMDLGCGEYDPSKLYGNPNMPDVTDNCISPINPQYEDDGTLDATCGTGVIRRSWYYTQGSQKIYIPSCAQTFTVKNLDVLTSSDITWPSDITVTCEQYGGYETEPLIGNKVVTDYTGCVMLAYTFNDQVFYNTEGFCFKVIRTHTVIDWCQYVPNSNSTAGFYQDTQTIYVSSSQPATIEQEGFIVSETFDEQSCKQDVVVGIPIAFDNCLGEYVDGDQISYTLYNSTGTELTSGVFNNNTIVSFNDLSKGNYKVEFSIISVCNNTAVSNLNIDIQTTDTKRPTPYCFGGITTVLMEPDVNGNVSVEIWASDFDLGAYDNCTASEDLIFSFSPNTSDQFQTYTCSDIGEKSLRIYVTDECGNQDYCNTTINIQDNDHCNQNRELLVAGNVATAYGDMVEGVEVSLENMTSNSMSYGNTDQDGHYAFDVVENQDYNIQPTKNDEYLNGVTTLDLVLIQKHILGLEEFDQAFKFIAADANNSETVSAIDLVEIRKLILGVIEELPNNNSWRFVDKAFQFADISNPWNYSEDIYLNSIEDDAMSNDFTAIKIGDVNGSASLGLNSNNIESRQKPVKLLYDIQSQNGLNKISFKLEKAINTSGFQIFITTNANSNDILDIESDKIKLQSSNFNVVDGKIAISYHEDHAFTAKEGDILFAITLKDDTNKNELQLSTSGISEIYDENLNVMALTIDALDSAVETVLYQNTPNPFDRQTTISFNLEQDSKAKVTIMDVSGKVIKAYTGQFGKGFNSIIVDKNDLVNTGLLYYKLETHNYTNTKKMMIIQ